MPPPPSYYDITSVPFSHTFAQADFNAGTYGGTANTTWLRRITTAQVALGFFVDKGGTFKADITIYESDGSTVVKSVAHSFNVSFFAIVPAGTYYIKIVRHGGGASDFDFTVQADERPTDGDVTITPGMLVINDDTVDLPAAVVNPDGSIVGYLTAIPAGETAALLPSGVSLWHDATGSYSPSARLHLFDANFQYVTDVDAGLSSSMPAVTNSDTEFFVVDRNGGQLSRISAAGVVTTTGTLVPTGFSTVSAIGANANGSILYWLQEDGDGAIHRYDLVNDTPLSDLYAIPGYDAVDDRLGLTPNGNPGDVLVQPDGSVVVWYQQNSSGDYVLLHLSAAGSLLHSYTFAAPQSIDHIAKSADGDHVYIWLFTNEFLERGQFGIHDLTTGLIASDFTTDMFSNGENLIRDSDAIFAPSASCTFFAIGVAHGGGGGGEEGEEIIGPLLAVHFTRRVAIFEEPPS